MCEETCFAFVRRKQQCLKIQLGHRRKLILIPSLGKNFQLQCFLYFLSQALTVASTPQAGLSQ